MVGIGTRLRLYVGARDRDSIRGSGNRSYCCPKQRHGLDCGVWSACYSKDTGVSCLGVKPPDRKADQSHVSSLRVSEFNLHSRPCLDVVLRHILTFAFKRTLKKKRPT